MLVKHLKTSKLPKIAKKKIVKFAIFIGWLATVHVMKIVIDLDSKLPARFPSHHLWAQHTHKNTLPSLYQFPQKKREHTFFLFLTKNQHHPLSGFSRFHFLFFGEIGKHFFTLQLLFFFFYFQDYIIWLCCILLANSCFLILDVSLKWELSLVI